MRNTEVLLFLERNPSGWELWGKGSPVFLSVQSGVELHFTEQGTGLRESSVHSNITDSHILNISKGFSFFFFFLVFTSFTGV